MLNKNHYYCFDKVKPYYRGVIHKYAFICSPVYWYIIISNCTNYYSTLYSILSLSSISGLFLCSFLYHCWNYKQNQIALEITFLSLDISFISFVISFALAPCYIFLINSKYIILYSFILTLYTFIINFISLYKANKCNVNNFLAQTIFTNFYLIFIDFSYFELILITFSALLLFTGSQIYYYEYPNPYPLIFGYHEIWHLLIFIALMSIMFVNYSVIVRYKN